MGVISAIQAAAAAIPGMGTLTDNTPPWFSRTPDRKANPPTWVLIDNGRDPVIREGTFEGATGDTQQVVVYNLTFTYWAETLADCESWQDLMDSVFLYGQVAVAGLDALQEGIEVGSVLFSQERDRGQDTALVHSCTYPIRVPYVWNPGA